MIDQTTLKGNKNTNSDTFRTKAPLSARKERYEESLKCIRFTLNGGEAPSEPPQNPIGDVLLYTVVTTGNISANRPLFTSISVNTPTAKARWLPIL